MFGALRQKMQDGETLFGYILTIPSTRVARMLARTGADWIVVDAEHTSISPETVHDIILATSGTECAPMVRLPHPDEAFVKPALDSGAVGIWIPQVDSARKAQAAVRLSRFPPQG